jgi:hypothetical protein
MPTERQVRALLPVAKRHGEDMAAEVYRAVAEAGGRRVTARLLAEAAGSLPSDGGDPAEAVRAYLSQDQDEGGEQDGQESSALDELAAEVRRMTAILRRVRQRGTVERAAAEDAEAVYEPREPRTATPAAP